MSRARIHVWAGLLAVCAVALGESSRPSAETVAANVAKAFASVQDYSVRVTLSVQLPSLRVPKKELRLFFKRPDKLKLEADGFAIFPREGLADAAERLFRRLEKIRIAGEGEWAGRPCWLVSGAVHPDSLAFPPAGDGSGPHATKATLWVDQQRWALLRVEMKEGEDLLFTISNTVEEAAQGIWLPVETLLELGPKALERLPQRGLDEGPLSNRRSPSDLNAPRAGTIHLMFSDYRVNRGLRDDLFTEGDK